MGSVILLKSDKNVLGKYVAACLRDRRAKDRLGIISGSTAQQAIYIRDIRTLAIPLPPLAEQQRIVAEVERRLSVVEELEAVVNASQQRATRLRQSILQRAFEAALHNGGSQVSETLTVCVDNERMDTNVG
jgi:type I restriction enzyme S subunit